MGDKLRADRLADGDDPADIEKDVERSWKRITGAPIAILVCLTMEDMDEYPDQERRRAEYRMAAQGVAMAGENLLLAAHAHGLGACWMCAPLFAQEVVAALRWASHPHGNRRAWCCSAGLLALANPETDGRWTKWRSTYEGGRAGRRGGGRQSWLTGWRLFCLPRI